MLFRLLLSVSVLASSFPFGVNAGHESPGVFHRHQEIAKRSEGSVELFKRYSGVRLSYYNGETGQAGSCGQFLVNSDSFVAVNAAQMNPAWCFKTIRITFGGKTAIATIKDTCPSSSCPWGGLDLSPTLFTTFATEAIGIIYGDWEFTDEPTAQPTPTSTYHPPPPPPKTSSVIKTHSSSSSSSTSRVVPTSSSSIIHSSASLNATSSTVSSAAPTSLASGPVGNWATLNEVLIQFAGMLTTGSKL